jgi:two-component system, LytTR family, sensor kinase
MHPAIFVGSSVALGLLFALQEWTNLRMWSYHIAISQVLKAWGMQYFIWGVLCWLLWWWMGPQIQSAGLAVIITRLFPLSIAISILEEMIWVVFFPNVPLNRVPMSYWRRFAFQMSAEFVDNLIIFWCAFGLFRAVGYYQKYLEKEATAAQLETQLTGAQLQALRMQLNPHFLFNTMNGISSLMRLDIEAADTMLEQLGSLLRITLERGDSQLIPLHDEMEFIEMYMALQGSRYGNRVHQSVEVDAGLHDALVPAMILQPIVENAYAHGLSKLDNGGSLVIAAHRERDEMRLSVLNSGIGLHADPRDPLAGRGVGLANTRSRLKLHYGRDCSLIIREAGQNSVEVTVTLPVQLSRDPATTITRFGG